MYQRREDGLEVVKGASHDAMSRLMVGFIVLAGGEKLDEELLCPAVGWRGTLAVRGYKGTAQMVPLC